jgi:predicted ATPase
MIHAVRIQNFKNLRNQGIELEPLTVFVGANGSGKTSVLEAIHLAVRAATSTPRQAFARERHCDWLYTRGGREELIITCLTEAGRFTVKASPPVPFPPNPELLGKQDWDFEIPPPPEAGVALGTVLLRMTPLDFLRLDPRRLARPSYSDRDPPQLEYDGAGLASVLAYMALNDPQGFEDLVAVARTLIPRLRRIRFRKAKVYRTETELVRFGRDTVNRRSRRPYQGELILFDFEHAENISARTASEGTMLMLGLLTVLLGPSRPQVLLMDDIEHGLHPLAQKALVGVLRQVMAKFPELQIVATAHSPYLVDYLRPDEVRLMTIGEDGFAVCGRLVDHPQFGKWKDEMAPGELWSLFGEKWLAEGVAAK